MPEPAVGQQARLGQDLHRPLDGLRTDLRQAAGHPGRARLPQDRQGPGHLEQFGLSPVQARHHGLGVRHPDGDRGLGTGTGARSRGRRQGRGRRVRRPPVRWSSIRALTSIGFPPLNRCRAAAKAGSTGRGQHLGDVAGGERSQPDAAMGPAGDLGVEGRNRGLRQIPLIHDQQNAGGAYPAAQIEQQPQRQSVHQVDLVDADDHRALPGQFQQHIADLTDDLGLRLPIGAVRRAVFHGVPPDQAGHPIGDLRRQPLAVEQLVDHARLEGVLRQGSGGVEQQRTGIDRDSRELIQQLGLPAARPSADQHQPTVSRPALGEQPPSERPVRCDAALPAFTTSSFSLSTRVFPVGERYDADRSATWWNHQAGAVLDGGVMRRKDRGNAIRVPRAVLSDPVPRKTR